VPAGGDLQAAINSAVRGDTIVLQVANFTTQFGFSLPAKPGTFNGSNYITIQSANLSSLPLRRMTPADVVNMPTLTVIQRNSSVLSVEQNATGYKIVGLQITNDLTGNTSADITATMVETKGGSSDNVFDRCVVHPKEHPTLANAWLTRGKYAFNLDGNNITIRRCYVYDFFGRDPVDSQFVAGSGQQTEAVGVSPNVNNLLIENNYLQAWYATMQTAGADGAASSVQTVLSSPAPTLTSARLSSVAGLSPGMMIALDLPHSDDVNKCAFGGTGMDRPCWAVGRVATVDASTGDVTFSPSLITKNGHGERVVPYSPPMSPGAAVWSGTQPTNITMNYNTLEIPYDFAAYHLSTNGNTGKGVIEGKSCYQCTFEGNIVQGFPSSFSLTTANQNGGAPWMTTAQITIRNNWFTVYRTGILLSLTDYGSLCTQGHDILIDNNLFTSGISDGDFLRVSGAASNLTVTHNTATGGYPSSYTQVAFVASGPSNGGPGGVIAPYYPVDFATGVVIRDNLTDTGNYVATCYKQSDAGQGSAYLGCFANPIQDHNGFVQNVPGSDPFYSFPGPTTQMLPNWSAVQFVGSNPTLLTDWALLTSSPFHNNASDGTDRGVNIPRLAAALSNNDGYGSVAPLPSPSPTVTPSPTPSPTATPTPTPTPTPSSTPIPGPGNASATFIQVDSVTQGNWKNAYGLDGYQIINDVASYPQYAQVNPSGPSPYTWASSTTDVRGLQKAAINDRIAAAWYEQNAFTIDVNLTDGAIHRFAVYCVDWDDQQRSQKFDVVDPSTNSVLSSQTVSSFTAGKYLVWDLKGHVKVNVTRVNGANAVVSGLYFGVAATQNPTPTPTPKRTPLSASITSPTTNATYGLGSSVTITANASDTAGNVTNMSFKANSQAIGSATAAPYQVAWSNMSAGTYTVTATAQDDQGVTVTSAPITVKISKAVKSVRGVKTRTDTLSNSISGNQQSLVQDSGQTSALIALVADLDQTYSDFLDEKSMFSAAPAIEKYLFAASYLARASAGLSAQQTASSAVNDRLKKIDAYLSFCEDLMVDGVISSSTVSNANMVNALVNLSLYQPEISPVGSAGFNVSPNGTARITSVASNPFSTQTATASGGGSFELADVGVTFGGEATKVLSVSPTELTVAVPADLSGGIAEIIVSSREGFTLHGAANVAGLNPRLFGPTGDTSGCGVVLDTFSQRSGPFSGSPAIWIGLDARTRLSIIATGLSSGLTNWDVSNDVWLSNGKLLENLSESVSVLATAADGRTFWLTVEYAGAQGQLPGIDQINVVLPPELAGAGTVQLTVVAGGHVSNTMTFSMN